MAATITMIWMDMADMGTLVGMVGTGDTEDMEAMLDMEATLLMDMAEWECTIALRTVGGMEVPSSMG